VSGAICKKKKDIPIRKMMAQTEIKLMKIKENKVIR